MGLRILKLKTPLSDNDVRALKVGDVVYLTGIIVTARDLAHKKAVELLKSGGSLPLSLRGLAVFHAGPIVRKEDGKWRIIAIGPTTSTRMENIEYDFIKLTGVKMVIGKGGMGEKTRRALKEYCCVYAVYPGGAAAIAPTMIEEVVDVYWLELGIPEALWVLKVRDFGPLITVMDSHGNNLYEDVMRNAREVYKSLT